MRFYEVNARRKDGKIVFRIWEHRNNFYVTEELSSRDEAKKALIEFETIAFSAMIKEEAIGAVLSAENDGFETSFVTSGSLDDPWRREG